MANTPEEVAGFRAAGLPTLHAPASLFVSERVFRIEPVTKRYDSIYVGHFRAGHRQHVKRQDLAADISRLRIVTYPVRHEVANGTFVRHFLENFPELEHAEINDRYLSPHEVVTAMNSAAVNLALSSVEGCMYAFTEALLCGLPAVSTMCQGGREQFFHPKFVKVVDPSRESVARVVEQLAGQEHSPEDVRRFALARLEQFRAPYVAYVAGLSGGRPDDLYNRIFGSEGCPSSLCFDFERTSLTPILRQISADGSMSVN